MQERDGHNVFVYGTLRSGATNAFRMRGSVSLGRASLYAKLYRVHEQFPGVVLSHYSEDVLVGEVFSDVSDDLLYRLDMYEGCDQGVPEEARIYRRVKVVASLDAVCQEVECWVWVYLKSVDESQRILNGDWLSQ